MAQLKKVADKKVTSKTTQPKKVAKTRVTITATILALFDKKGIENVSIEEATKAALRIKKNSKFNKWHLYYFRKVWRKSHGIKIHNAD